MERDFLPPTNITPEDATQQLYKNWRERFAFPLLVGVLIFGGLALLPAIRASDSFILDSIFITSYLLTAIVTVIPFSYSIRMTVFLFSLYILGVGELITHNILGDSLFFFLALIIFATMLLSPRAGIATIGISLITFIVLGWLILNNYFAPLNPVATPALLEDWLSASAATLMVGVAIILGFRSLEREFFEAQIQIEGTLSTLKTERNNLENSVQERTQQLRKINEIERNVSEVLDAELLLTRAADFIESEFAYYYTAFYLTDPTGKWLELKYASGEAGKVLKENKHRIDLESKSCIANAIRLKAGQITSEVSRIRMENPLLPYTRSQLALPLLIGDTPIGVLDMHSNKNQAFTNQDVDAYQNMANGIATALENARLFQEAKQTLSEMRATQRQYLQNAWGSLVDNQSLEYALGDEEQQQKEVLSIPLALRDQIIGQIQMSNSAELSLEQRNVVETIITQATLALENARLVEESQSAASHERLTNEIIAKIWASTNIDSILQTTVRELGRTLEASEVEIEISMEEQNEK
jgi:GAF domain-containing protein